MRNGANVEVIKKNTHRRVFAALAGILAVVGLAGCTASPTSESDSKVVVYAGRDEALIAPLIAQFTEETGIAVDVRYGSTPELSALLIEEGEQTPANVFLSQDAGALGALSQAGLLARLPADITEAVYGEYSSADDTWVGVTGRARVIAYDSEKLSASDIPSSVLDLTDSEWSGRVGFPPGNASFQAFVTALRVLEGEKVAEQWVADMAKNSPVLTEKNGATLDLVNAGQLDLALINHYYWFERAAEIGAENMRAQLKYLPGDAGGIVNVTGAGILKNSAQDDDALAFVKFLVSESAQRYFVTSTFEYPLIPGIESPAGQPTLDELVNNQLDLANLASLAETQALLAKYGLL
jgi:iron(III) transport system substrate-binding protein